MQHVTKHTRAGKNGKVIQCPKCRKGTRVYHFCWSAGVCSHCGAEVPKTAWILPARSVTMAPYVLLCDRCLAPHTGGKAGHRCEHCHLGRVIPLTQAEFAALGDDGTHTVPPCACPMCPSDGIVGR